MSDLKKNQIFEKSFFHRFWRIQDAFSIKKKTSARGSRLTSNNNKKQLHGNCLIHAEVSRRFSKSLF